MHSLLIHPSIFHLLPRGSAGNRLHNKCFCRLPNSICRTGILSESLPTKIIRSLSIVSTLSQLFQKGIAGKDLPSKSLGHLPIDKQFFHLLQKGIVGKGLPYNTPGPKIKEGVPRESRSGRNYEHYWLTVPAKLSILIFVQASTQTYTMGQAQFRYFTTFLKHQLDKTVESNGGPTGS
ncbi:Uncharacterized protein HZ326_11366 [Fusarium oxysporum f. sp. albedinis]|nr:Uncharacterized protein HZ326_11366 [Fusarium oxysporum f. sp. albedinis]